MCVLRTLRAWLNWKLEGRTDTVSIPIASWRPRLWACCQVPLFSAAARGLTTGWGGGRSKDTHRLFLQSSRWNYLNSTSCGNSERMPSVDQKWWGIQRLKIDGIWLTRKSNQRKNPGENQGECAFFREPCGCSKLINQEGRSWVLGRIMCVSLEDLTVNSWDGWCPPLQCKDRGFCSLLKPW